MSSAVTTDPRQAPIAYSAATLCPFFNGGLRKIDTENWQAIIVTKPTTHLGETTASHRRPRGSDWATLTITVVPSDTALLLTRGESGEKQLVAAEKEDPPVYAPGAD